MRYALLVALAACGPATHTPPHVEPVPRADAGVPIATAVTAPTDAECSELIAHALALGVAADREPTSPEAQAKVRTGLEADFMTGCKAQPARDVRCGIAATTVAAFTACQASASSSTSNSSVAPPGIAPPAPRAP